MSHKNGLTWVEYQASRATSRSRSQASRSAGVLTRRSPEKSRELLASAQMGVFGRVEATAAAHNAAVKQREHREHATAAAAELARPRPTPPPKPKPAPKPAAVEKTPVRPKDPVGPELHDGMTSPKWLENLDDELDDSLAGRVTLLQSRQGSRGSVSRQGSRESMFGGRYTPLQPPWTAVNFSGLARAVSQVAAAAAPSLFRVRTLGSLSRCPFAVPAKRCWQWAVLTPAAAVAAATTGDAGRSIWIRRFVGRRLGPSRPTGHGHLRPTPAAEARQAALGRARK